MSFNFNVFSQSIYIFNDIVKAYYNKDGGIKFPSAQELKAIESDAILMSSAGKVMMGGGIAGVGAAYILWSIPCLGPLLGLATGVSSVAVGVLGYDLHVVSQNLQGFANNRIQNLGSNIMNKFYQNSEEAFKKELIKTSVKGTVIGSFLYHAAAGMQQKV